MAERSRVAALWTWYDGAGFRGYQAQPDQPTVQGALRHALRAAGFGRNPVASGRTDAGVHARMQVLSMRVPEATDLEAMRVSLAPHFPAGLGVAVVKPAHPDFNASWRTTGKEYRYRLATHDAPSFSAHAWRVDLDVEVLEAALALTLGTHDFSAFHDPSSVRKPRTLTRVTVARTAAGVIDVQLVGDGFARFMVRSLIGSAVAAAQGEWSIDGFHAALSTGRAAGRPPAARAPPHGLVLWNVSYAPSDDPFSAADRAAPSVPHAPPFVMHS